MICTENRIIPLKELSTLVLHEELSTHQPGNKNTTIFAINRT